MEGRFRRSVRGDQGGDVLAPAYPYAAIGRRWLQHPADGLIVGFGEAEEELLPFVGSVLREGCPCPERVDNCVAAGDLQWHLSYRVGRMGVCPKHVWLCTGRWLLAK